MRDKTVDVSASVRELLGTLESQRRQHDSDQRIIAELRAGLEAIANGKDHCGTPARYVKDIAAETLAKAAS